MKTALDTILTAIGEEYKDKIMPGARHYLEVDLGQRAAAMGAEDDRVRLGNARAIIPLKEPVSGMKVRIDGRAFKNYYQFESGVAVPGYVAMGSKLPKNAFTPNDSMILNCA